MGWIEVEIFQTNIRANEPKPTSLNPINNILPLPFNSKLSSINWHQMQHNFLGIIGTEQDWMLTKHEPLNTDFT